MLLLVFKGKKTEKNQQNNIGITTKCIGKQTKTKENQRRFKTTCKTYVQENIQKTLEKITTTVEKQPKSKGEPTKNPEVLC